MMIQPDPIVEEVRRVRDAYAARFNYNLRAMFEDLKKQERESGRKCFVREAKKTEPPTSGPE
jgi:hypothetical protein